MTPPPEPLASDSDVHATDGAGSFAAQEQPLKKARVLLRSSALANNDKVVERDVLKEVVEENRRRWSGCLMLPVTWLTFLCYMTVAVIHDQVSYSHMTDAPIREWLSYADPENPSRTALEDVTEINDVWTFVETTFLPLFFRQTDSQGKPIVDPGKWGNIFQYSRVIGAVEMQQLRSVKEPCSDALVSHLTCYPPEKLDGEEFGLPFSDFPNDVTQAWCCQTAIVNDWQACEACAGESEPLLLCPNEGFAVAPPAEEGMSWLGLACPTTGRRLTALRGEVSGTIVVWGADSTPFPDKPPEGKRFIMYLDTKSTVDKVRAKVDYLRQRRWLDEQTTNMELRVIVLNVDLPVPHLQEVRVAFVFHRGGGVYTALKIESILLSNYSAGTAAYVLDFLFLAMLLGSQVFLARSLISDVRKTSFLSHFTFVNTVSWCTCVGGWINIMWFASLSQVTEAVQKSIINYEQASPEEAGYYSAVLHEDVKAARYMMVYYRVAVVFIHILFMMRTFLSLQWQPRLAVVTQTLRAIAVDLVHFLIVLLSTFMAFALAGNVMFGKRIFEFSTLPGSFFYTFEILMECEYDWEMISKHDLITSAVWIFLYLLMVVFIMLNMVLAIIMDVYREVRNHSGDTMTVWAHIRYIYRRMYYRHQWYSDSKLLEGIQGMPPTIAVHEMRDLFPDMNEYQLQYLAEAARNKSQAISRIGVHPSYTASMVAALHSRLQEILTDIRAMKTRGWMACGMEVGQDADRVLVKEILSSVAAQRHWMTLAQKHMDKVERKATTFRKYS